LAIVCQGFIAAKVLGAVNVHLRIPFVLLAGALAAIAGFWWFIGQPVPMPPSPLAAGEKLPCVSYAPFRRGQSPFTEDIVIPASQIDEDFAHLSTVTDCVRIYSVDQGLENVPALARKHGLQVVLGMWIGRDREGNAKQIEAGIRLANENPDVVRLLAVGNEALLRGEISEEALGALLKDVKAKVSVPITYADVWEFWVKHRPLADLVDVVTVHILPYWEDEPVPADEAGAHLADIRKHVGEAFPGKSILIGETGWPSQGRMRWGARATPADQARVLHDIVAFSKQSSYDLNLIEAFDQPWKRISEGTVGGYWGLLDADTREPKFQWGKAVSNHPHWREGAGAGLVLAVLTFAVALVASRRERIPVRRWIGIAVLAAISGCAFGLAVHMQWLAARNAFEIGRSLLCMAFAFAAPLVAAAGIARGLAPAPLAELLGRRGNATRLELWLAGLTAATAVLSMFFALGLVFDPRYREFPTATLIGAVSGLVLMSLLARRGGYVLGERVFAVLLAASIVAIVIQERIENWEALSLAGVMIMLAGVLALAGRGQAVAGQAPVR
jgi:exo-beta-1,3-glucanase (GH17 family)